MQVTVLYFAWVRERVGHGQETIETTAKTISELVNDLRAKGPEYEAAFSDLPALRAAADEVLCDMDASLDGVRTVAFFPPMTGG